MVGVNTWPGEFLKLLHQMKKASELNTEVLISGHAYSLPK